MATPKNREDYYAPKIVMIYCHYYHYLLRLRLLLLLSLLSLSLLFIICLSILSGDYSNQHSQMGLTYSLVTQQLARENGIGYTDSYIYIYIIYICL